VLTLIWDLEKPTKNSDVQESDQRHEKGEVDIPVAMSR
jgi:hypothetical protein